MTRYLDQGALLAIVFSIFMGIVPAQSQAASIPESENPIKIVLNEWTGQHISASILGNVLEEMGYNVDYVTVGAIPQMIALSDGTLHVQPEVWTNLVGDSYAQEVSAGRIDEIGLLGLDNREGWIYPKYMEETCPGLPALSALVECTESFSTGLTFPKGRVVTYPADWGTRSADLIAALQLPFEPVPAGSEGAMVAELKAALIKKNPLVMMFWTPHWILAEADVGWIEISPAFEPDCLSDPAWGPSSDSVADCDFEQARVVKATWSGVKDQWPGAYKVIEQYSLSGEDQAVMMLAVDQQGAALEDVVDAWMNSNESRWKSWIGAAN